MAFRPDHEIHRRRFSRNLGLGLVLAGLVALVFALTVVKITRGNTMQGFDHVLRPELLPAEPAPAAPAEPTPATPETTPGARP